MNQFWKMGAPVALALMVVGCAAEPAPVARPVYVPPPVANAPVVPPSASTTVPETDPAPVRRRGRVARVRGSGSTATGPAGSTEQTTAGPSAVGRQPAAAQPTGTGGS